jgi:hypothetical protein
MTEHQRLFLVQARSAFVAFELLRKNAQLPPCHALHYLQMSTELLGKARRWKAGPPAKLTHKGFVWFLDGLRSNPIAQKILGFAGKNAQWDQLILKSKGIASAIEKLAPDLARDGPNPEYPWPKNAPEVAPAEHAFELWSQIEDTAAGRRFLSMLSHLFKNAEQFV